MRGMPEGSDPSDEGPATSRPMAGIPEAPTNRSRAIRTDGVGGEVGGVVAQRHTAQRHGGVQSPNSVTFQLSSGWKRWPSHG